MAIVKLENGTTIKFDGDPTQMEIDHAVSQAMSGPTDVAGSTVATSNTDTLSQAGNLAQAVFPNKSLGAIFGNIAGPVVAAVKGTGAIGPGGKPMGLAGAIEGLKNYDYNWGPEVTPGRVLGNVAGDAINLGSLIAAPATGGSSLLLGAGVSGLQGAGLSISNSLSDGKSLTDPEVLKNAAGAGVMSAFLHTVIGKSFSQIGESIKSQAGITPKFAKVLAESTPGEIRNYIQAAAEHNLSSNVRTPIGLASERLAQAGQKVKDEIDIAGKAVGAARKEVGNQMIAQTADGNPAVDEVLSNFNKQIEEKFGHEISIPRGGVSDTSMKIGGKIVSASDGEAPSLIPLEGRMRTITPADNKRIMEIHRQLYELSNNPQIKTATDVIHNADDLIDWTKVDQYGVNHDPLEATLRSIRGQLNGAIRESAPAVADANDEFSRLKDIERGIGQLGGKDLQRGELLLRRVFSGDKSRESIDLLNSIKEVTGVDLVKEATLAKFATDNFGDAEQRTLMQQYLNQKPSLAGGFKSLLMAPVKAGAKKFIFPNTEKYAMNLARGNPYANWFDELSTGQQGKNLVNTFLVNAAASPSMLQPAGNAMIQGGRNLINNTTGIGL